MRNLEILRSNSDSGPGRAGRDEPSPLLLVPIGDTSSPLDLLHEIPIRRLNLPAAREALTFAFASGDGDVFARLIDRTPTAASDFVPDDFVHDLELGSFIERCMPVFAEGKRRPPQSPSYLLRVLSAPPREAAHVAFRQRICAELAGSPLLVESLEVLYVRLRQFHDRMRRQSIGFQDGIERRLGILQAVRAVIESLSDDFAGSVSGLDRLFRLGESIAKSPGYRRLCDLLDYEQRRAELDLRVSLGFDGRIRSFQILEQRENRRSAFHSTAFGRVWTCILLLVNGYRATTGEILSRLIDSVFAELEPYVVFFFQLLADVEVYLAALGFRRLALEAGQDVCLAEISTRGPRVLCGLFNPWLVADGRPCQACDLALAEGEHLVFITGANSGGKTRLLQSLCLCQLLGQGGLFVPAARAELRRANGLFASLIEIASADQVEGRLGTELLRIRRLFEHLRCGSLIVMDELCSGTNPSEGEALMKLVLEALYELAPQAFISTHFLEFAAGLARTTRRHRFLQAELDAHERPTYRFTDGVARTSLAHRVAERLGVTRESLR
ncbi:MAG TPA: DNA mismatch repair protein, partial [Polyangiaceae bacterium]|nr:DNA mismatch repair protein [Polyangiaceae bacterium]